MILIEPIQARHISGFRDALDSVARERKFLASTTAPPLDDVSDFVMGNIKRGIPQFVAVDGETVVGWIDISIDRRPVFAHRGTLGMGVVRSHRGRGIGTRLITAALEEAKVKELEKVELEVFESNTPAVRLYEKFGFQEEGRKMRASKIDDRYENHIMMGLFLTSRPVLSGGVVTAGPGPRVLSRLPGQHTL